MEDLFDRETEEKEISSEEKDGGDFSAISDIIEEARIAAEEEKRSEETEEEPPERAIEVSENTSGDQREKSNSETLKKLKNKIKDSELLDPKVIKDMFFGTESGGKKTEQEPEEEEEEEEEIPPILFDKSRKKRMTADPKQDKKIFETEYMVTPAEAAEGYELFYNEFVKPKNIKLTVLFGAAAAVLLICAIVSRGGYLNILMLIISLSVIAFMWLSSYNAGRQARLSADDIKNDSYKLSFYNSRILIEASELAGDRVYHYSPVMIRFEDIELKVIDYDSLYVLVLKKNYIYTVPKSSMTDKMNEVFKKHLSNILGDDYREYYMKQDGSEKDPEKERE